MVRVDGLFLLLARGWWGFWTWMGLGCMESWRLDRVAGVDVVRSGDGGRGLSWSTYRQSWMHVHIRRSGLSLGQNHTPDLVEDQNSVP